MSLFTDSGRIGISDLEAYESTLSKIASTHGINLDSKTTIAIADIGDGLLATLARAGSANSPWFNPTTTGRYNMVSFPPESRWYLNLDNVVVTPPLQRWISYAVLSRVFAEAYNVQLNDRFKNKWMEYSRRAREAEDVFYQLGIGVVYEPLPQPPEAQVTAGTGTQPAGIITVQTAWADANGNESMLSPLVPVTLGASSSFTVAMRGAPGQPPVSAAGWNLYVGSNGSSATRQNSTLNLWNEVWSLPASGLVAGSAPVGSQQPDAYIVDPQRMQRG
jgi:hypothetical protein